MAASDDLTGAADQGGDWDLELNVGIVEAVSITAENWNGTLLGDADGDGLDHADDLDDDNDGILDADEGFSVTTETLDLSSYEAGEMVQTFSITPDLDARVTITSTNGVFFPVGGEPTPQFDPAATGFAGGVDDLGIAFDPPNSNPSPVVVTVEFFEAGTTNAVVVNAISTEVSDIDSSNPTDANQGRRDQVTVEAFQGGPNGTAQSVALGLVDAVDATVSISGNVATGLNDDTAISSNDDNGSITVNTGPADSLVFTYEEVTNSTDPQARGIGILGNFTIDVPVTRDTDGDGIADHKDLDSDNDGISDLVESGADASVVDTDGDGVYDNTSGAGALVDADGVPTAANGGVTPVDSDGDGLEDYLDLDSDNDGISDTVEAFPTVGYTTNDGDVTDDDTDGDGVIDAFDTTTGHGGDFTTPEDTDSDGTADFLDADSDNDGLDDIVESGQTLSGTDANGDGIDDAVNASYSDPNGDVDDPINDLENNTDNDPTDVDYRSVDLPDKDGDGVADAFDLDDDNDGITDVEEGQIAELVTFSNALDGTTPVNDVIVDTIFFDGVGNVDEQRFDNDNFTFATGATAIPGKNFNFNEDELAVLDAGGQYDLTFDYSGQALVTEVFLHLNSFDSIRLELLAAENPNIGFEVLSGSNFNQLGTNGDLSFGDDDQTTFDTSAGQERQDGVGGGSADGTIRFFSLDGSPITQLDFNLVGQTGRMTMGEGWQLAMEVISSRDTDMDGVADHCDLDSDNDGISDLVESGDAAGIALDVNGDGTIDLTEGVDTDGDGLIDVFEDGDLAANTGTIPVDSDGDGLSDTLDLDSDDDGIPDIVEAQPTGTYVALTGL